MVPVSIMSSALAAQRRLSFYITVNLASVLAPGIVIVFAIIILIGSIRHPSSPLTFLTYFKNYTGASTLLASILVVAAGYVFGYVSRELAFKFLQQFERLPWIRTKWQEDVNTRLQRYFSQDLINDCRQAHRALGEISASESEATGAAFSAGGGHSDDIGYRDFTYAKLWIRNYAAGFSVDSVEAEINILASGLIPTLLAAAGIVVITRAAWPGVIAGVIFLGLTWSVILDSLLRLRHTERWEALRNLVMDYAMREASNKIPPIQDTSETQQE
jgi:hypothetical protein